MAKKQATAKKKTRVKGMRSKTASRKRLKLSAEKRGLERDEVD